MVKTISGIYIILNTKNGKVYVGKTAKNFKGRWKDHQSDLKGGHHFNPHLQAAWNLYGAKMFQFKVLEYCPIEQLNEREKHHIKIYRKRGLAYNLTDGGVGGCNPSEETRRKLSEANKGKKRSEETRRKISEAAKNPSEETRRKISEANKRRPPPNEETRRKISVAAKNISEETRRKLSEAAKGNTNMKGKTHSEETRRKLSVAQKRRYRRAKLTAMCLELKLIK
jgi:group I intron endonuclease